MSHCVCGAVYCDQARTYHTCRINAGFASPGRRCGRDSTEDYASKLQQKFTPEWAAEREKPAKVNLPKLARE